MNDAVAEKLVQKVTNMLEEMSDLNIQVRRLTPTQETLNRINERIDAMNTAIMKIEKGVSLDEKRITELEEQTKSVQQTLNALKEAMGKLTKKAEEISVDTDVAMQHTTAADTNNKIRFQQLENTLNKWFGEHKVALIALAVAQVIFFIVVLFK